MKHPITMLRRVEGSTISSIILLGNPVVWWGSGLAALIAAVMLARRGAEPGRHRFALAFLFGGAVINYLPFIAIRRLMFIYHYLFALVFLIALSVMVLGVLAGWNDGNDDAPWRFPSRRSAALYWGVAAIVLLSFAFFAPFTYGTPLSQRAFDAR